MSLGHAGTPSFSPYLRARFRPIVSDRHIVTQRLGMVLVSACLTIHSFSSGMSYSWMHTFMLCAVISCYWKINLIWFDLRPGLHSLDALRNAVSDLVQRDLHRDLRADDDGGQPAEVVLRRVGTVAADHKQSHLRPTVDRQFWQATAVHARLHRLHTRSLSAVAILPVLAVAYLAGGGIRRWPLASQNPFLRQICAMCMLFLRRLRLSITNKCLLTYLLI